jgi:hypothetical protein
MKPASSSLWTSAFVAATFSSDILWSFCFLGYVIGLTCSLCSIISLLALIRSKIDHLKTSLLFVKEGNSSALSSGDISVPKKTTLSSTLESRAIFLVSP